MARATLAQECHHPPPLIENAPSTILLPDNLHTVEDQELYAALHIGNLAATR